MKTQTGLATISLISVVILLLIDVGVLTTMILALVAALGLIAADVLKGAF